MKIKVFILIIFSFQILLTGCPYSNIYPIDEPNVKIDIGYLGNWEETTDNADTRTSDSLRQLEGNSKMVYEVTKKSEYVYEITTSSYELNSETNKYEVKTTIYEGYVSNVNSAKFLNIKQISPEPDGKYYFYKLEVTGNNCVLTEVTMCINKTFSNSAEVKAFILKNIDNELLYSGIQTFSMTQEKIKKTTNSTFTDSRDGHVYKTVTIGTQTWMVENLAYKASSGCWAYNDDVTNVTKYGYLYNWETAKTVCPTGWHLPTNAEWTTLTTYFGGESVAGGKLKEISTTHWTSPNTSATNESGFTALPGGYRDGSGTFDYLGDYGLWWSSVEYDTSNAWSRDMRYYYSSANRLGYNKADAFSVRCVRDY